MKTLIKIESLVQLLNHYCGPGHDYTGSGVDIDGREDHTFKYYYWEKPPALSLLFLEIYFWEVKLETVDEECLKDYYYIHCKKSKRTIYESTINEGC